MTQARNSGIGKEPAMDPLAMIAKQLSEVLRQQALQSERIQKRADAKSSRSSSRASSAGRTELPVTIPEEERDDTTLVETELKYPEGITNVCAIKAEDLVAECRILVTRHAKLHTTDLRLGCKPARFECMILDILESEILEKEREWIIQNCKENNIKYEDRRVQADDAISSVKSVLTSPKTADDIRKIMCEAAQAPAGDALDFAKAIGKERDKCNSPALPGGMTKNTWANGHGNLKTASPNACNDRTTNQDNSST